MLYRKDYKYDLLIPIKYNFKKRIPGKGSCIFIHLTKDYKPTAGCIALKKKDFLIMLKIIKKNTKIKIY
jgi:L,D-peptidoglycan transpeptidase YkuD (ErfK/YbiS/YcfS/YnhG family)